MSNVDVDLPSTAVVVQMTEGSVNVPVIGSSPGGTGGGFDGEHNDLDGRSTADAHPITAITGLQAALEEVAGGASALADLTDVDTTTDPPDADDVLAWDGVTWTPATLTALGAPGLSNATPADLGTAAPGVSTEASRADHVHDLPTAADVGAAASLHVHSGADITSGTVATARLGSGTANATTFLRGDGTWTAPASSLPGWFTDLAYSPLMGTALCRIGGGGAVTIAFGADTLIMWRIMAVETVDIDGVMVMTQTAGGAGQQARFGIYSADVNGVPSGAAVVDSGAMSVSSAATLLTSTFTAVRLQPYRPMWAAMLTSSAAVTFRFLASAGSNTTPGQMLDTGIFGTDNNQIRRATGVTFGALPTAPSMPFSNITNIIPGVFWRTRRV